MTEVDVGRDLIILRADVALEITEVDEIVIELSCRRIGWGPTTGKR